MRVGSLVVVKPLGATPEIMKRWNIKWLPVQDEETIYTIREMDDSAALLEEGIVGNWPDGREYAIRLAYLREVQPPMDLMEELEECLSQPLEYA